MQKASAINLVLLGGGMTLIGATMALDAHNRMVACERAHASDPDRDAACRTHGGGGGHGSGGGGSSSEAGISRGGFGGTGEGHGGGG